jgi:hypothetical protein
MQPGRAAQALVAMTLVRGLFALDLSLIGLLILAPSVMEAPTHRPEVTMLLVGCVTLLAEDWRTPAKLCAAKRAGVTAIGAKDYRPRQPTVWF